jgi:hypothetical protein
VAKGGGNRSRLLLVLLLVSSLFLITLDLRGVNVASTIRGGVATALSPVENLFSKIFSPFGRFTTDLRNLGQSNSKIADLTSEINKLKAKEIVDQDMIGQLNQLKNVLLDSADSYFTDYAGNDMKSFYALNVNRARYKERLDPGNISINLSGSVGMVTLIDNSGGTDENVTTAGRIYYLASGSLNIGSALTASINTYTASNGAGFGLFYPDMGIVLLNPAALSASVGGNLMAAAGATTALYHQSGSSSGSLKLYDALKKGADFQARRTENVSTSHYFVRANNREFNFSNNPTFVSGSVGAFVNSSFEKDPKVYITTVGLYDDGNELLAVAKTSQPIAKSFDKEIAIKVKLDF